MKQRPFGNTGISVSELALGTSPLGGGIFYRDDREALAVLQAAHDAGINYFDTGESYGNGLHEELLGQAFGTCRDRVVIASKGGIRMTALGKFLLKIRPLMAPAKGLLQRHRRAIGIFRDRHKRYTFRPEDVRTSLEGTLRRLKSDYVDVYQYYNASESLFARDDAFDVMERFKAEGKIRFGGATVVKIDTAFAGLRHQAMDCIQVPVNFLEQVAVQRFLPLAMESGVAVIGRSPLASGFLTDTTGHIKATESSHISAQQIAARRAQAEEARALVGNGRSVAEFALRYALQVAGVSTVLFSVVNREQLAADLKALDGAPLSQDEIRAAERIAPLPPAADATPAEAAPGPAGNTGRQT
ncbi:aldo/keto reductase [Oceanibacterium hippocampi]|uniref:General stress protein 69 n=1 Tax=Oceanibacterium hippocampi TaxID=745714 RepID=A0A1Y5TE83_9PROT|nr:aldo/keto reductase [Oceanibacterium hippocampi]SLN61876.1 General stress protein 69 [Oceanibacterium hippocampi]